MAARAAYTAQAIEEYINQNSPGNQAVLEQELDDAGNFLGQCTTQLATTDQKAEALAKKMVEDEQRINERVTRTNETTEGMSMLYGKVVEMHSGIEQMKKDPEKHSIVEEDDCPIYS